MNTLRVRRRPGVIGTGELADLSESFRCTSCGVGGATGSANISSKRQDINALERRGLRTAHCG